MFRCPWRQSLRWNTFLQLPWPPGQNSYSWKVNDVFLGQESSGGGSMFLLPMISKFSSDWAETIFSVCETLLSVLQMVSLFPLLSRRTSWPLVGWQTDLRRLLVRWVRGLHRKRTTEPQQHNFACAVYPENRSISILKSDTCHTQMFRIIFSTYHTIYSNFHRFVS